MSTREDIASVKSAAVTASQRANEESIYPSRPEWDPVKETLTDPDYEEQLKWTREAAAILQALRKSPLFLTSDKKAFPRLERWADRFTKHDLGENPLQSIRTCPAFFPPQIWRAGRDSKQYVAQWRTMRTASKRRQAKALDLGPEARKRRVEDWEIFEKKGLTVPEDEQNMDNEEGQDHEDVMSDPDQLEDDEEDDYGQNYFDPGEDDEVDDAGAAEDGGDYD